MKAVYEKKEAEKQLQSEITTTYSFIHKIISGSFCKELEYIKNIGIKRWLEIEDLYHKLGKKQGYDEDQINNSVFEFIEIYAFLKNMKNHINIWLVWRKKIKYGFILMKRLLTGHVNGIEVGKLLM